jgi:hypothetical protein
MLPLIFENGDVKKSAATWSFLTLAKVRLSEPKNFGFTSQVHELRHLVEYELQKSLAKQENENSSNQERMSSAGFCKKELISSADQILQISIFAGTFIALHHNRVL